MELLNGGLLTKFIPLYDPTTKLGNFAALTHISCFLSNDKRERKRVSDCGKTTTSPSGKQKFQTTKPIITFEKCHALQIIFLS